MIKQESIQRFSSIQRFINNLNKTENPLKHVFNNTDCYIAGGFPRLLLRDSIYKYSNISEENNYNLSLTKYFNISNGDIDVFFTSHDEWFKAIKIMANKNVPIVKDTIFAKSFVVENKFFDVPLCYNKPSWGKEGIKVQLIKLFDLDIEKILSRFDLHNSMIAFNKDKIFLYENLIELETKKELDISSISSADFVDSDDYHLQIILSRLLKYSQKYDYKTISDSSINKLQDFLLKRRVMFGMEHKINYFMHEFFKNRKIFTKNILVKFVGMIGQTVRNSYQLEKNAQGTWVVRSTMGDYGVLFDRALQESQNIDGENKKKQALEKNISESRKILEKTKFGTKEWGAAKYSYLDMIEKHERNTY